MSKVIKSNHTLPLKAPHKLTIKSVQIVQQKEVADEQNNLEPSQLLHNAYQEAEKIINEAMEQKKEILSQIQKEKEAWNEEKQSLMEEAQKTGYQDGFQKGKEDGYKQYENVVKQAEQLIHHSKKDYQKKLEQSEETIIKIAMKAAEKILAKKLEDDDELFLAIVREVIHEVKEYPEVKIYVHPDKYAYLLDQKDELKELFTTNVELYIFPDHHLKQNGIYVESPFGKIDASVDTQLEQLKTKLLNLVRED